MQHRFKTTLAEGFLEVGDPPNTLQKLSIVDNVQIPRRWRTYVYSASGVGLRITLTICSVAGI